MQEIKIEFQRWGDNKGRYLGKITFEDGQNESFSFNLTADTCQKYLLPIAEEVIKSAKELGDKLAQSFTREIEGQKTIEAPSNPT